MPRRILVIDGHRHRNASGYGEVARGILLILRSCREFEVSILPGAPEFEHESLRTDWLERLPVLKDPNRADAILQIGQPSKPIRYRPPTAYYTMFDPSRPPTDVLDGLRTHHADLVLVPNEYNRRVLAEQFYDVRIVPPLLDHKHYRPRRKPAAREDGEFVFLFHGAFGYRKGLDLLLEAFLGEFRGGEARLHLHCPGLAMRHVNSILGAFKGRAATAAVEIFHKTYSQEWIANFYNAAGAVVSLTRAEAWGLPISNAVLCGRPVVVSRDWGMAEYLPPDYPYFVDGERRPLASIVDPDGADWRDRHGGEDNEYFEASIPDARRKLRAVFSDPAEAERQAERARAHLLEDYHPERIRGALEESMADLVEGRLARVSAGGSRSFRFRSSFEASREQPKVSALVPCFEAEGFLEKTLDHLARQTWPNLEIVIADDASRDGTPAVALRFAKAQPNVRVIRRDQNLGWLGNANDLLLQARGDYAFFAFHDDLVSPTCVEKLVGALQADPGAVLAYGHVDVAELDGRHRLWRFDEFASIGTAAGRGRALAAMPKGWWVPHRGLFPIGVAREIGGLRSNDAGEFSADWTWLLALALRGRFVCVPEVLCLKQFMPGSVSKSWSRGSSERRALRRAGLREVALSPLGPIDKLAVASAIRLGGVGDELRRGWKALRRARELAD